MYRGSTLLLGGSALEDESVASPPALYLIGSAALGVHVRCAVGGVNVQNPDVSDEVRMQKQPIWFMKNDALDNEIRDAFGPLLEQGKEGKLESWEETPLGTAALVILLDQFPRNTFRGSPDSFAAVSATDLILFLLPLISPHQNCSPTHLPVFLQLAWSLLGPCSPNFEEFLSSRGATPASPHPDPLLLPALLFLSLQDPKALEVAKR